MNNQKSDWFVYRFMNRVVDDDVYRALNRAVDVAVWRAGYGALEGSVDDADAVDNADTVSGAVKDDPDHPALQVFLWEVTA